MKDTIKLKNYHLDYLDEEIEDFKKYGYELVEVRPYIWPDDGFFKGDNRYVAVMKKKAIGVSSSKQGVKGDVTE